MKRERVIEFVGGSEEDIAYLRLQIRKAAKQLHDKWRLRREDDPKFDLLIIEDGAVEGLPTVRDAMQRRVRFIDPAVGAAGLESALWPMAQEQIVQLLNASRSAPAPAPPPAPAPAVSVALIQYNIYDDLFEQEAADRTQSADGGAHAMMDFDSEWAPPRAPESAISLQAEQLFRKDPRSSHRDALDALRLHDEIGVEATDGKTLSADLRKQRRDALGNPIDVNPSLSADEAAESLPLASYLTGKLLPGPARIEVSNMELTLDPRNRQYYAKGALCIFEDCCKQLLRRADWHSLSAHAFAEIKQQCDPRPFVELLWLCAYVAESSAAADSLDTQLRFRLIQSLDLQRDYPSAARVVRELEQGASIAAAASAARVPLAQARRVAAAFDAVGFLIPD